MIYKYAPPSENDTENYLAQVVMRTGIGPNDVIGSLDSSRFKALIKQVQKHEGWIEGTVKVDKSSSSQSAFIPYKDAGTATQGGKFEAQVHQALGQPSIRCRQQCWSCSV